MKVKADQSGLVLCDPMDCTVCGILQVKILEWVTIPFSRGSSQPRDQPRSPALQADSLPAEPQGKPSTSGYAPKIIESRDSREENGNPLQCSCLENPRDRGAWWAAIYGVAQSESDFSRVRPTEAT